MNRNQRLAAARLLLHDQVCINGAECTTREDHARRTQHVKARRVVDGGYADLVDVIHENLHPMCERPVEGHINTRHRIFLDAAEVLGIDAVSRETADRS